MAGSFFGLSLRDSSNEVGKTDWNTGDLTALTLAGALTQMGQLTSAIQGVTIGVVAASRWGDNDIVSNSLPTDPLAQRGVKWNVSFEDNVTHVKGTNYIPTADLTLLPTVGGKVQEDLDLTVDPGLELKTRIQALCKSAAGNAITVLRVYYSD